MKAALIVLSVMTLSLAALSAYADDDLVPDDKPYHSAITDEIRLQQMVASATQARGEKISIASTPLTVAVSESQDDSSRRLITVNRFIDADTGITCYATEAGGISCTR